MPTQTTDRITATNRYQTDLLAVFDTWSTRWTPLLARQAQDVDSITEVVNLLARDLDATAENLADAYLLGSAASVLSSEGEGVVLFFQEQNRDYLRRLADDIAETLTSLPTWTRESIAEALRPYRSRVARYDSAFWVVIWAGLSERARRLEDEEQPYKVRRSLDPRADHCGTCPGKVGEYPSWDAMLEYCGGLPGDGSDACGPGCRCSLELLEETVKEITMNKAVKGLVAMMTDRRTETGVKEIRDCVRGLTSGKKALGEKRISCAAASASVIFGPAWLKGHLAETGQPESTLDLKALVARAHKILDEIKASSEASRAKRLRIQYGGEIGQWL